MHAYIIWSNFHAKFQVMTIFADDIFSYFFFLTFSLLSCLPCNDNLAWEERQIKSFHFKVSLDQYIVDGTAPSLDQRFRVQVLSMKKFLVGSIFSKWALRDANCISRAPLRAPDSRLATKTYIYIQLFGHMYLERGTGLVVHLNPIC